MYRFIGTKRSCVLCNLAFENRSDQEVQSDWYCPECIAKLNMTCPVCGSIAGFSQDEKSSRYFGYHCSKCKGTWFDLDILEFRPDGSMFFIRYDANSK